MVNFLKKQLNRKSLLLNSIYILNISLPMLIFAFFFLSKKYDESVDYMLVVSLSLFLAFSLSGNYRQTLVGDNDVELAESVLQKRIFLSLLIFVLSFLISLFILDIKNHNIILIGTFISIIIWLNEINLILIEIKKKFKFLIAKFFFNFIFLIILFYFFFILTNKFLETIIVIYTIIFFFQNFDFKIINKFYHLKKIKFIFNINYISSVFLNLSSFLFKYEINFFLDKKNAALLFFCISAGSSLSTITFNSIGPKDFKDTIKLSAQFILLLLLYLFACIFTYLLVTKGIIFVDYTNITKYTLTISIIGGLIFTYSYIFRQNIISKKKYRSQGFTLDIIYSIFTIIIVPGLYVVNKDYLFFVYLVISIFSFLIYYYYFKFITK
jgi:hypothetical protein